MKTPEEITSIVEETARERTYIDNPEVAALRVLAQAVVVLTGEVKALKIEVDKLKNP